ncbi:hypothetical protein GCM10009647_040040 [Streptomyces sanglieri]|uniref:CdiI immunity protein domain-containing protein n=1 Tax=Streptomyces sanglieri TaxID=193460 RepID=A0ABW2X1K1_9ACTN
MGGEEAWNPSADDLFSSIEKVSQLRRSSCPSFLDEFVEMYASRNAPQELDQVWIDLVNEYPWYAEDVLYCSEKIIEDESITLSDYFVDFVEFTKEEAGEASLSDSSPQDSARAWLRELHTRFNSIFTELSSPSSQPE